MPIIDINGKKISENNLNALTDMLRGSLENHIEFLNEWKNSAPNREEVPAVYDRIIQCFQTGLHRLEDTVRQAKDGRNRVQALDLIGNIYSGISDAVIRTLDQEDMSNHRIRLTVESFLEYCASDWADPGFARKYPNKQNLRIKRKDRDSGFRRTVETFEFMNEPLDWIGDIEEYHPGVDSIAMLYAGRRNNSGTLKKKSDEIAAKLVGMQENDPRYRATVGNLERAQMGEIGLRIAGEKSVMKSTDLRDKKEVSFADVYDTLKTLNASLLPNDAKAGKLRGTGLGVKELTGTGTFAASAVLYKTLTKIADGINQVKKVEDPALRKSRAIQLAAFSYQMLISEHVFPDANGRTSRLFADTILQTFGLPPHTPLPEELGLGKTMGEPMDFTAGANVFYQGIQRSEQILREEREKDIDTAEQRKTKRHDLLEKIKVEIAAEGAEVSESAGYQEYARAMEDLDGIMDALGKPMRQADPMQQGEPAIQGDRNPDGPEKNLTREDKNTLLTKMIRVAEAGERFLDSSKRAGKNLKMGVYATMDRLQKLLSRDYDVIMNYDPQEAKSLNTILTDSRTLTVDFRNKNIKTLGNMQSSRIPMTIYGADGKKRTGVFTKATHVRVKSTFDQILRKAARGCTPEAVSELNAIPDRLMNFLATNHVRKYDGKPVTGNEGPAFAIGWLVDHIHHISDQNGGGSVSTGRIRRILTEAGVHTDRIPDNKLKILSKGLNTMRNSAANWMNPLQLQLKEGDRLDQRNTAMSVVAGLLGVGSLLARADSMRYVDSDGKVVEGTFMDFGKGLDLEGDSKLAKHLREDPLAEPEHRNNVYKSLVDLKIIDFICLNVDRHPGNVMYQVDAEGNMTGIQGIDNDCSFGPVNWNQADRESVRVISRSMKDRISRLTPEMLKFALRGRGLTEEEMNASAERLKYLQNRITKRRIRVVPDNGFESLSAADMMRTDNDPNDPFRTILTSIREMSNLAQRLHFEPYVDRIPEKTKVDTTLRKYTVGGMMDLSDEVGKMLHDEETGFDVGRINRFGRRSAEFSAVLEAATLFRGAKEYVSEALKPDQKLFLSEPSAQTARQVYDHVFGYLERAVDRYLSKKLSTRGMDESGKIKGKNDYEKNRIEYVKKLKAIVKQYEACKRGPVKKEEIAEKDTLITRREQNKKNHGPGMH